MEGDPRVQRNLLAKKEMPDRIMATIQNFPAVCRGEKRSLIRNLLETVREKEYQGVDIDFEDVRSLQAKFDLIREYGSGAAVTGPS